jgi:hypothetical protein
LLLLRININGKKILYDYGIVIMFTSYPYNKLITIYSDRAMKPIVVIIVLFFVSVATFAQSAPGVISNAGTPGKRGTVNICTPNRNKLLNTNPLYVVYSHDKIVYRSDTSKAVGSVLGKLDQHAIKSMNIVKDSTATQRFGTAGQWGVIEIQLDDANHPDAYKALTNGNK